MLKVYIIEIVEKMIGFLFVIEERFKIGATKFRPDSGPRQLIAAITDFRYEMMLAAYSGKTSKQRAYFKPFFDAGTQRWT